MASPESIYISSDDDGEQESIPVRVTTYIRENVVSPEFAAKDVQFWRANLGLLHEVLVRHAFRGQVWGLSTETGGYAWKSGYLTLKNFRILLNAKYNCRLECVDAIVEAFKAMK